MTFETEVLADSPELWWDTRQASGAVQPDRSGNGKTGTIIGAPTLDADGLTFDGSGQYVISDADFGSTTYPQWSVEVVFTATDLSNSYQHLAGIVDTGFTDYLVALVNSGGGADRVLDLEWVGTGGHSTSSGSVPPLIAADTRYHAVFDYDGTAAQVYLDGTAYANTVTTADFASIAAAANFLLGDDSFGDGFTGPIRHGVFYAQALGPTRAAAHATAALGDDPAPEDPMPGGSMVDATAELRSLTMGTGTSYAIEEPGIVGLGVPTTKTADTQLDGRDGSFGAPDFNDVRVITIPIVILGTDAADAFNKLDNLNDAWQPARDGVDLDLVLTLPGWGEVVLVGRPRGVVDDCALMGSGIIRALCRFDALDPAFQTIGS